MVVNWRLRARIGDGKKFNIYSKWFETAVVRNLSSKIFFSAAEDLPKVSIENYQKLIWFTVNNNEYLQKF